MEHVTRYLMRRPRRILFLGPDVDAWRQAMRIPFPDAEIWQGSDLPQEPGNQFDTVFLSLVFSWEVISALRPYLALGAQTFIKAPQTRNLALLRDMVQGKWPQGHFSSVSYGESILQAAGFKVLHREYVRDRRLNHVALPQSAVQFQMEGVTVQGITPDLADAWLASDVFWVTEYVGGEEPRAPTPEGDGRPVTVQLQTIQRPEDAWRSLQEISLHERLWAEENPVFVRFHVVLRWTERNIIPAGKTVTSILAQLHPAHAVTVLREASHPDTLWPDIPESWRVIDGATWGQLGSLEVDAQDWLVFVDAGDGLKEDALYRMGQSITANPDWRMAYTDEEILDDAGWAKNPHCKPDLGLDTLRSVPYVGGCLTVRGDLWRRLKGFSLDCPGVEDYDLVLRATEEYLDAPERHIGHVARVLYQRSEHSGDGRMDAGVLLEEGRKVLEAHVTRCGEEAEVEHGAFPATYRCVYTLPSEPRVTIFIPTRNQMAYLSSCVESIVEKTDWPNYEIVIIDNGSDDEATLRYLAGLDANREQLEERIRVFRYPGAFNYSAMHNAAVAAEARGSILLFLNNDTAVLQGNWLRNMLRHALRPRVGAVGAKLLFPDGRVQHGGVILGIAGKVAEHPFLGEAGDSRGYYGRLITTQNYEAVTAACMMVQKVYFDAVSGFDEALPNQFNDVDFCLKLGTRGLRHVWTPDSVLMHHGSATQRAVAAGQPPLVQESSRKEQEAASRLMFGRWAARIGHDRAYNPNLTRSGPAFTPETKRACLWQADWRPRKRVITHPVNREGTGEYRVIAPGRILSQSGRAQVDETQLLFTAPEMAQIQPDSVVFQLQLEHHQLQYLKDWKALSPNTLRVFEVDDLIVHVPMKNVHRQHLHKDLHARLREAAKFFQRMTVTTEPLVDAYRDICDDIRVVPNYIERARWGHLRNISRRTGRPRVGWAGGVSHTGDLEIIADVVRDTHKEIEWVFMGMCPDTIKPYVTFVPPEPLDRYPVKLASLELDLGVAPLEIHPFNEGKSHLRLLEYGILGIPVICTDIVPYQGGFPVKRVKNRFNDWRAAVLDAVADREALALAGESLRDYVNAHWILEDHAGVWEAAWT